MKLESEGILISLKPFNEKDAVGRIFTRDFGVLGGMLKGGVVAKKNKPLIGQVGAVAWNARLDSQLGTFHWEAEKNLAAPLMMSADKLIYMNAAFEILVNLLPEREAYVDLYDATLELMRQLLSDGAGAYLVWEMNLLKGLGYAMDLSKCSGCGTTTNLKYVSPKTARAVCAECGEPYDAKLYRLPVNLNVTARFLEGVCMQQGGQMPQIRKMLN